MYPLPALRPEVFLKRRTRYRQILYSPPRGEASLECDTKMQFAHFMGDNSVSHLKFGPSRVVGLLLSHRVVIISPARTIYSIS